MIGCLGESRATQESDVVARAVAAMALAALAVIHVVDLPGTLGPTPLVGIGYFGIVAVATMAGAVIVVRWLRAAHRPRTSSALRALPGWPANRVDQDRPLRPVQ
jgi:hypothetical protein